MISRKKGQLHMLQGQCNYCMYGWSGLKVYG